MRNFSGAAMQKQLADQAKQLASKLLNKYVSAVTYGTPATEQDVIRYRHAAYRAIKRWHRRLQKVL